MGKKDFSVTYFQKMKINADKEAISLLTFETEKINGFFQNLKAGINM